MEVKMFKKIWLRFGKQEREIENLREQIDGLEDRHNVMLNTVRAIGEALINVSNGETLERFLSNRGTMIDYDKGKTAEYMNSIFKIIDLARNKK